MSATLVHRGPDSSGEFSDGGVALAARRLSIIDLETGDQPIANEDGTVHVVQNGEIYNYRELRRELERAGHRFRTHGDTEVLAAPLRGARRPLRRASAGHVRDRDLGRTPAAARARTRPLRNQAALLPRRRRRACVRLRAARPAARRDRPRRAGGVPRVQLDPRAADDLPRDPQAPAGTSADLGRRPRSSCGASPARRRSRSCARTRRRSSSRSCARACATPCARTSSATCRSAFCSRAASTRRSSPPSPRRRAPSRCGRSRSASRSAPSTSSPVRARRGALRDATTASSCSAPTRRCSCPRSPTRSTSRSPTRRRCRPTSCRSSRRSDVKVALSGEGGDELFGGYYTYAADLLAAARRRARAARAPARRAAADTRRRRRASTTRRSASSAPHTCRRSSGTTAGRRSSRPSFARSSPAARRRSIPSTSFATGTRETEGADELARLQDVDLGIYLVDDLLVKTDRASMAHSLEARVPYPRHGRDESRARASDPTQDPRPLEEGPAAQGSRAAPAARDRPRQEARLLDPGRGLAPRRARAVRAADALARDAAAPGLLPARMWSRGSSTTTSPAARTAAASSGACSRSRSGTSATSSARRRCPHGPKCSSSADLDSSEWPADLSSSTSSARGRTT